MSDPEEQVVRQGRDRARLALALVIAAVLLVGIFQVVGAVQNHFALAHEWTAQQPAVVQGQKLRDQVQTLAGEAAELARNGDVGAGNVVAYLHRHGVTIRPPNVHSKK